MSFTNTPLGKRWYGMRATNWVERISPPWRAPRLDLPADGCTRPLTVPDVVAVNRLMACLERNRRAGGHAPGIDGLRYPDFGRQEAARAFGRLRAAVRNRSFRPQPYRPTLVPKKDRTFRELLLAVLAERALATSLRAALDPVLSPLMSPLTFSTSRAGSGVGALLAALAAVYEFGDYGPLLNLDVRRAFPSVPIDGLMAVLARYVTDDHMLWLVETLVRGAENSTLGIPQGLAVSPLLLDLYMSVGFDLHWPNAPGMPFLLRYVDNLPCLVRDVYEGRDVVERCRDLLGRLGLSLKDQPEGEYLIDLTAGTTTELLGFRVSLSDGKIRYDVTDTALEDLRDHLRHAHDTDNPPATAKAVLEGWFNAVSPAFDASQSDVIITNVLSTARRMGFREFSPEHLKRTWASAYETWDLKFLRPARRKAMERKLRT